MSLSATLSNAVARTYKQFGERVTISQDIPGAYDPTTGTLTGTTTKTATVYGTVELVSQKKLGYLFDGAMVQGGEMLVNLSAKGMTFVPMPGDSLITSRDNLVVVQAQPVSIRGILVSYTLLVRK